MGGWTPLERVQRECYQKPGPVYVPLNHRALCYTMSENKSSSPGSGDTNCTLQKFLDKMALQSNFSTLRELIEWGGVVFYRRRIKVVSPQMREDFYVIRTQAKHARIDLNDLMKTVDESPSRAELDTSE